MLQGMQNLSAILQKLNDHFDLCGQKKNFLQAYSLITVAYLLNHHGLKYALRFTLNHIMDMYKHTGQHTSKHEEISLLT